MMHWNHKSFGKLLLTTLLAAGLTLAACGDETETIDENTPVENNPTDNNPTDNNPTDNNPTDNNPTDNNPTDNNPTDNNPTDNNPLPPVEREPIGTMTYEIREEGSRILSITVNVINNRIGRSKIDPARDWPMDVEDVERFKDEVLTQGTYDLFIDGWSCPEVDTTAEDYDNIDHRFEGEIFIDDRYETILHDITGCVVEEDPAVMDLIEVFQEMRYKYYPADVPQD